MSGAGRRRATAVAGLDRRGRHGMKGRKVEIVSLSLFLNPFLLSLSVSPPVVVKRKGEGGREGGRGGGGMTEREGVE